MLWRVYFDERNRSKNFRANTIWFTNHRPGGTNGGHSLSFAALSSSLKEGAGDGYGGLYHSTGYSLNRKGTGDFHRPYETQRF